MEASEIARERDTQTEKNKEERQCKRARELKVKFCGKRLHEISVCVLEV